MYDDYYAHQILIYLQQHIPVIESALSVLSKLFPFVALIAVLLLLDRLIKKGDLI